jgi:folate-dependent phosphoribosylglycinamide formyltransferase PurN
VSVRVIVLTSTMRRHRYVANRLAERLDVVGVWQEEKSFQPLAYAESAADDATIQQHFDARDASEEAFFADHDTVRLPSAAVRRLEAGGCNDPAEIDAMRRAAPDAVLVFGTALLKQPLIDAFPGRIINIHLGLSPYYRGAGTNFWPLVNDEPEYCGATIHLLDAGVDTGPILVHVRAGIDISDGPHQIGNKTIVAAADALADAAIAHARTPLQGVSQGVPPGVPSGVPSGVPQHRVGRVYRRADFSAAAVRTLYANFERGMIERYLRHRSERDARVALVSMAEAR